MSDFKNHVLTDGLVAVFGGPYSNLEATRALLDDISRLRIPARNVVCTGDIIAYGADAAETLALVRASGCHVVMGNVEENLAASAADCGCGFEEGSTCDRLSAVWFGHASAQLSANDRAWMADLPRRIDLEIGRYRFAVVHGGVDSINQVVFASTDAAVKLKQIDQAGADGVIGGHCGMPFTQSIGGRLWHNSGAIGMPANDGTARVWYSIFRPEDGGIEIEHRALRYDQASAAAKMRRIGLPEYANALGSGVRVDAGTLPLPEQRICGVPLEEGRSRWQPALAGKKGDDASCRQLWPNLIAERTSRPDRATIGQTG
jgi:predicted phosphodiesterase